MSSMNLHRRICVVLLSIVSSWPVLAEEWAVQQLTVSQLMQALASHRAGRATFTETTYLAILKQPLESSGELSFTAPDYLQKLTLAPKREVLTLRGDEINIEHKARKQVLRVSDYPQIAALIDSIRATLMGDRVALENTYQLTLSGSEINWHLVLMPKVEGANGVRQISIDGNAGSVTGIEIVQADGDRSVMRIANIALDASAASEHAP
jgi:outer membrane lipoprotein-sorting protein